MSPKSSVSPGGLGRLGARALGAWATRGSPRRPRAIQASPAHACATPRHSGQPCGAREAPFWASFLGFSGTAASLQCQNLRYRPQLAWYIGLALGAQLTRRGGRYGQRVPHERHQYITGQRTERAAGMPFSGTAASLQCQNLRYRTHPRPPLRLPAVTLSPAGPSRVPCVSPVVSAPWESSYPSSKNVKFDNSHHKRGSGVCLLGAAP